MDVRVIGPVPWSGVNARETGVTRRAIDQGALLTSDYDTEGIESIPTHDRRLGMKKLSVTLFALFASATAAYAAAPEAAHAMARSCGLPCC